MRKILILMLVTCFCMFSAAGALASVITINTPFGATMGGEPVDVQAVFTTSTDTVSIVVNNNIVDPVSVIQNLSDLGFELSTGQTSATLTSSLGVERTVYDNKTYTPGGSVATGWAVDNQFIDIRLHVLGTLVGPAHTIIGNPDPVTDTYANAGGSIAKTGGPHNPFLFGPVSFTLNVPGVTDTSTVTRVLFSFGTSEGNNIFVPVPGTLLLLGSGLLGLAAWRRRG